MNTDNKPLSWLQQQSSLVPAALGGVLGLGIGVGALFSLETLAGVGVCVLVLGLAFFLAKDAEPVLVEVEVEPEVEQDRSLDDGVPQPEPEPSFVEPLDMVEIAGGTFLMGSLDLDELALDSEKPQHEVSVSDFCISRYPITRQLYRKIVEESPEEWANKEEDQKLPVIDVTWFDAVKFCNALSEQVGLQACYRIDGEQVEWDKSADGYRLATEAEWEYACRARTTSRWFFGDDPAELGRYAWFSDNSDNRVHPVGEKEQNPFRLHDMIGNVWEWCWDWYGDYSEESQHDPIGPDNGSRRVLRGGSAWFDAASLRSAFRFRFEPVLQDVFDGFRCVRRPRRQP